MLGNVLNIYAPSPGESHENGSSLGRANRKYLWQKYDGPEVFYYEVVSLRTLRKSGCFWNMVQFTSTVVTKAKTLKVLMAWFLSCRAVCKFKVALKLQ